SKEEDNKAYLESTLGPWMETITSECDFKLLSEAEHDADTYFEYDTYKFIQADIAARFAAYEVGLKNKFLVVNEIRSWEGMNAVPWGDEPVEEPAPAAPGQPAAEDEPEEP